MEVEEQQYESSLKAAFGKYLSSTYYVPITFSFRLKDQHILVTTSCKKKPFELKYFQD